MRIQTARGAEQTERRRDQRRGRALKRLLRAGAAIAGGVLLLLGSALLKPERSDIGSWLRAPGRYLQAVLTAAPLETLALDIKFKHLHRLHTKREDALAAGRLNPGPGDFVPASAGVGPDSVDVELRLLGRTPPHFEGELWSLEVRAVGDSHVLGMRRFALYPVAAVAVQRRMLEAGQLRDEGLAAPRTLLLQVAINGDEVGLAFLEELPSVELVDASRQRAAVLVHFDAQTYWEAVQDNGAPGPYDNFHTAPIEARATEQGSGDDVTTAVGLLRGFLAGAIPARRVFDAAETGRFLAVCELWEASSALHWTQMAFYYDPLRARLAPIARPGSPTDTGRPKTTRAGLVVAGSALSAKLLADEEIRRHFVRTLRRLARDAERSERVDALRAAEAAILRSLHREAPLANPLDLEAWSRRAASLQQVEPEGDAWFEPALAHGNWSFPRVLGAYALEDSDGPYLELFNLLPVTVRVTTLRHDDTDGAGTPVTLASRTPFPIELPPTPAGAAPTTIVVRYRPLNTTAVATTLRGVARVAGDPRDYVFRAKTSAPALDRSPVPTATLDEALDRHPYLRVVPGDRALHVGPGLIEVNEPLVLPSAVSLVVEAGSELVFAARAALVMNGALHLRGEPNRPVVLRGAEGRRGRRWQGVALLGSTEPSRWSHAEILDSTGIRFPGWEVPASITVRDAEIEIESLRVHGSRADQALALVAAKFAVSDLTITESSGTALSLLHASGEIRDLHIEGAGRLGVLATRSIVTIRGGRIERVRTTAIEAGDRSRVEVEKLVIVDASIGMAAKNGARGRLLGSTLRGIVHVPLLAFSDRPELGGGELVADGNTFDVPDNGRRALAQRSSRVLLDGVAVAEVDADIGELRID